MFNVYLYSEPSLREKAYFEDLCAKLAAAQKLLGSAYCVLVLGVGMDKHHHMACGRYNFYEKFVYRIYSNKRPGH